MPPHYENLDALIRTIGHKSAGEKIGAIEDGACPVGMYASFNYSGKRWVVHNDCTVGRLRSLWRAIERGPDFVEIIPTRTRFRLNITGAPQRGLYVYRLGPALPGLRAS